MTGHSVPPDGPSIAVVGVGGVGGYLGGRLAAAGHDLQLLARGENLAALRRHGLRVTSGDDTWSVPAVRATDDPREIGEVDMVLLCVKTLQLPSALDVLGPMIGAGTAVLTIQNGVEAPEQVASAIGRNHVLPGVVRVVAILAGPGEIEHSGGPAALGFAEWDGSVSARVLRLRESLRAAGVEALEPRDIWADLWSKFMTIVPVGSLGAATGGATIGELRSRPGIRRMLLAGSREIYETGVQLGIALPSDAVDAAVAVMERQPPDATTSLQRDILADRPSELEAWTGAAVRLAGRAGRAAPVHEMLYELLATRAARTAASV
ncbi:2-dehydropantoate 2-reductase [Jatrophihabitans lederbergiae]|uniref:2-dehydropantoate 2-reductase n=1 Tax=Jatrophihabitans lederbergiae TaxID=3075547 RepID=A0ABU2JHA1_9ACTN|nr:2-dehydropantoate 2-reductase [Jatrophihabitans sp. DSM 44399]MDT0264370.1 2-dehydropantoate 2-reductase [Jatrophihabitans sp. DSM 44399]